MEQGWARTGKWPTYYPLLDLITMLQGTIPIMRMQVDAGCKSPIIIGDHVLMQGVKGAPIRTDFLLTYTMSLRDKRGD